MKKQQFSIRVNEIVFQRIQHLAYKERMSTNQAINILLQKSLAASFDLKMPQKVWWKRILRRMTTFRYWLYRLTGLDLVE